MDSIYKDAGQQLLQVIQEMGEQHTNPVLNILGNHPTILENQKFPNGYLRFGGDTWRAYYHCHSAPNKSANEHGHFHIFSKLRNDDHNSEIWSHVVALAMDDEGQPISWFTVNHWVTGAAWKNSNELITSLDDLPNTNNLILTEQWLIVMLKFYNSALKELLRDRDTRINQFNSESEKEVLTNHDFYELSRRKISILEELKYALN